MPRFGFVLILLISPCLLAEPSQRHLITTGTGEAVVAPDRARIAMSAEALHRDSASAREDVDGRINSLIEKLKALGIKEKDIVAASLRINPNYDYKGQERIFSGYRASRGIDVRLSKLGLLNKVIDAAVTANINNISQISLESSQEDKYRLLARERAIEDSKTKAADLARAYAAQLGPIFKIEYYNSNVVRPNAIEETGMRTKLAFAADNEPGRYLYDEIRFSDSIQVIFDLIVNE